jgi:hypothetical protein
VHARGEVGAARHADEWGATRPRGAARATRAAAHRRSPSFRPSTASSQARSVSTGRDGARRSTGQWMKPVDRADRRARRQVDEPVEAADVRELVDERPSQVVLPPSPGASDGGRSTVGRRSPKVIGACTRSCRPTSMWRRMPLSARSRAASAGCRRDQGRAVRRQGSEAPERGEERHEDERRCRPPRATRSSAGT